MNSDEAQEFQDVVIGDLAAIEALCHTNLSDVRRMVLQTGAVAAVRAVLGQGHPSPAFDELRRLGRLDVSMEALVVRDPYRPLFIDEEVTTAEWRLRENGFDVDGFLLSQQDGESL